MILRDIKHQDSEILDMELSRKVWTQKFYQTQSYLFFSSEAAHDPYFPLRSGFYPHKITNVLPRT